jgi:hypothetical protein
MVFFLPSRWFCELECRQRFARGRIPPVENYSSSAGPAVATVALDLDYVLLRV